MRLIKERAKSIDEIIRLLTRIREISIDSLLTLLMSACLGDGPFLKSYLRKS